MVTLKPTKLSRYPNFYRSLAGSVSREVRGLLKIVGNDPRSVTYRNLRLLRDKTGLLKAELFSSKKIRSLLPKKKVPESEAWRLGLLKNLFVLMSEK